MFPKCPLRSSSTRTPAGFTLIEIVMVLVLLGILSAVAVPKYFDLQEEANAKACQHNRGVVLSAIHTRMAAAKIADDSQLFDDSSDQKADDSANKVLQEDFIDKQQPLCPSGGTFSAAAVATSDGNYEYHVYCSLHAPASDSPSGGTGSTVVSREDADKFLDWLKNRFLLPDDQKLEENHYSYGRDLSQFFSSTGTNTEIDSGAAATKGSMANAVVDALEKEGVDTSNIIWRLEKDTGGWSNSCKGKNCTGTVLITIANTSDATEDNKNKPIPVSQYKMTVAYDENGKVTTKLSDVTNTTATLVKKTNKELDKNYTYWALKTT